MPTVRNRINDMKFVHISISLYTKANRIAMTSRCKIVYSATFEVTNSYNRYVDSGLSSYSN